MPDIDTYSFQIPAVPGSEATASRLVIADLEAFGSRRAIADWHFLRLAEIMQWTTLGHRTLTGKTVLVILAMDEHAYESAQMLSGDDFERAWSQFNRDGTLSDPRVSLDFVVHTDPYDPDAVEHHHFGYSQKHNPHYQVHLYAADYVGTDNPMDNRLQALANHGVVTMETEPIQGSANEQLRYLLGTGACRYATPPDPDHVILLELDPTASEPVGLQLPQLMATAFCLPR